MKKLLTLILSSFLIFSIQASAAIGSKGLILEGGKEQIILEKGEKDYIQVQDGQTKFILVKGISYYSDNTIVATIGLHSGILRANSIGTAKITAISDAGDAGQIQIKVVQAEKKTIYPWIIIPSLFIILYFLFKK